MEKINFVNNQPPYINAENLNQIQNNIESDLSRLQGQYYHDVDLNNMTTTGLYHLGTGLTNAPSNYIVLIVISAGGGDAVQVAVSITTQTMYIRSKITAYGTTTWTTWSKQTGTKYLGQNPDINELKTNSGIYGLYNCNQAPDSGIGVLEVLFYSPDWVIQRFTTIEETPHMWERSFTSGTTWNNWILRW